MICLGLRYILIADVFSLLLSNANCLDSRIDSAVLRVRLLALHLLSVLMGFLHHR